MAKFIKLQGKGEAKFEWIINIEHISLVNINMNLVYLSTMERGGNYKLVIEEKSMQALINALEREM